MSIRVRCDVYPYITCMYVLSECCLNLFSPLYEDKIIVSTISKPEVNS